MSDKKYLSFVIGRFSPAHQGHLELIREAFSLAANNGTDYKVVILLGSSNRSVDPTRHPLSPQSRIHILEQLIAHDIVHNTELWPLDGLLRFKKVLEKIDDKDVSDDHSITFVKLALRKHIIYKTIPDYLYNTPSWEKEIQEAVDESLGMLSGWLQPLIVGHKKDLTSYYLDSFPQWDKHLTELHSGGVSSTMIRNALYNNSISILKDKMPVMDHFLKVLNTEKSPASDLPGSEGETLMSWLQSEYDFETAYQKRIECDFDYIRHTVDSVVTCKGHVLLIRRRKAPGRGLWALPGGHINRNEDLPNAAIRELTEETCLRVSPSVLWNTIRDEKTFGSPDRSRLCRTITNAYSFPLNFAQLPDIEPADDAIEAKWFDYATVYRMWADRMLFEDHGDIINFYIANLKKNIGH